MFSSKKIKEIGYKNYQACSDRGRAVCGGLVVSGGVRRGVLLCLSAFASGACRCPTPQCAFCIKLGFFIYLFIFFEWQKFPYFSLLLHMRCHWVF